MKENAPKEGEWPQKPSWHCPQPGWLLAFPRCSAAWETTGDPIVDEHFQILSKDHNEHSKPKEHGEGYETKAQRDLAVPPASQGLQQAMVCFHGQRQLVEVWSESLKVKRVGTVITGLRQRSREGLTTATTGQVINKKINIFLHISIAF